MQFEQETIGDVLILRVREKEVTSHEAPEMKTQLLKFLVGDSAKILLDLKAVQNMDSTGLGSLLFGIRQAEQHEKDLRFTGIQSKVKFLMHVAHLEGVIDSYETAEQGLKAFQEDDGA
jgi:anti-sigma B factor antagonist